MKRSVIASFMVALTLMAGGVVESILSHQVKAQSTAEFYCEENGENPVTRVRTSSGNIPVIVWKTTVFRNYPPVVRCRHVSRRFQQFNAEGRLNDYITTGWINNQPVICVTPAVGDRCTRSEQLLFTLRHRDNPQGILNRLLEVRDFAGPPVEHNCPTVVYHDSGSTYINMQELIDRREMMASGYCRRRIR